MKIECKEDCGHAPLKQMIKDLNIAFGKGDVKGITEKTTDRIEWEMVGGKKFSGKEAVTEELEKMKDFTASELNIDHIITHGKTAACNGSFVMADGGDKYAFCDVYELDKSGPSARINRMISYAVKLT